MAITTEGSRRIIIDGTAYRWTVRPKPTYCQGNAWSSLSFAVEAEDSGGTTLAVGLDGLARPDNWIGEESASITPSLVERAIRQALAEGWLPNKKGGTYGMVLTMVPD